MVQFNREIASFQRHLDLLADGQTVVFDMLFALSAVMVTEPAPELRDIRASRD